MALFAVNTGLRDQELCGLEWDWEQRVPELDTPAIRRNVFLLPASVTKNGRPRLAILNDVAQSIVESQRGSTIRTSSRSSTSAASGRGSGRCATAAESPLGEEPPSGIVRSWARHRRRDSSASGRTTFGTRLDDVYVPRA